MTNKDIDQKYQSALDYLYSFVDYSMTRALRYSPDKFDLGRMVVLMDALGKSTKGLSDPACRGHERERLDSSSVCQCIESAAGYQTGLYTSPHLEDYTERIQVNGNAISHAELVELVEYIKPYRCQDPGFDHL